MTLCIVWKQNDNIYFTSDSRVTMKKDAPVAIAIKVACVPFSILSPTQGEKPRTIDYSGELGMCYSGTAASSLLVKEAVSEVLKNLQYAPGYTNIGMDGIANFIFNSYQYISKKVCSQFGAEGGATIIVAGFCHNEKKLRAYLLDMSTQGQYLCDEILKNNGDYQIIGSGKPKAQTSLPSNPKNKDFLNVMKTVIDDPAVPSVGGAIQFGYFEKEEKFKINGIIECTDEGVHHWCGGLDLNDKAFHTSSSIFPSLTYIDLSQ